jgi:hypothetical protein
MKHTAFIASALLVTACVATEDESLDVDTTQSALRSASPILTAKGCTPYAALDAVARRDVDSAYRVSEMSPEERRAYGVTLEPKLSIAELASYDAIQLDPCHVAAEWSCVSGGENGTHWAMCTNGTITCGASVSTHALPTAWCR